MDGLSGDAGGSIHVQISERIGVGVCDPGHFPFSGSHVWSWNVNSRSEESLLREFDSETTGHTLELTVGVNLEIFLNHESYAYE